MDMMNIGLPGLLLIGVSGVATLPAWLLAGVIAHGLFMSGVI